MSGYDAMVFSIPGRPDCCRPALACSFRLGTKCCHSGYRAGSDCPQEEQLRAATGRTELYVRRPVPIG